MGQGPAHGMQPDYPMGGFDGGMQQQGLPHMAMGMLPGPAPGKSDWPPPDTLAFVSCYARLSAMLQRQQRLHLALSITTQHSCIRVQAV